jgi:hypothetical protein
MNVFHQSWEIPSHYHLKNIFLPFSPLSNLGLDINSYWSISITSLGVLFLYFFLVSLSKNKTILIILKSTDFLSSVI